MRLHRLVVFLFVPFILSVFACAKSDERTYTLQGQVLSLDAPKQSLTVKHEEIKGFMPAMTMPYDVADAASLSSLAPGDLINATLVVFSNGAHLRDIRKVGSAPLEKAPAEAPMPTASSGFELLKPGDPVPNGSFIDQDGRKRAFADFKGARVVMTFIYTECPLPTFCPLMDRRFAAMQKPLADDAALTDVRLLSVSFDPITDTPPILKAHARRLNADPDRWSFLTGDRDEVDRFAARFGVQVSRALNDAKDITHNLRTVVIDKNGTLVKVYTGNDWSTEQVIDDVKKLE
jgi:protein SCO1/2